MSDETIAARIHGYIRDEVLCGQDAGLLPTTPLLQLGILDSFGLLGLVAHLNGAYGIDIRPDEITGHDFRTIESIARLVAARQPPSRAGGDLASAVEGPAVFEAPDCAQLFVLFTGIGRRLDNGRRIVDWPVSKFFQVSGITGRNLIAFGDPYGQSYRQGVSADLPTPEDVCAWLGRWIAARTHIDEVYCIGISSGGPMAIVAGERLRARTVWAFGARPVRHDFAENVHATFVHVVERATGRTLAQLEAGMSDEDRARIDAVWTPEVAERYHRSFADPAVVIDEPHLQRLVELLSHPNGTTRHTIVYCSADACDAFVAERLRGCPTVRLGVLAPATAAQRPWAFSRWAEPVDWIMRNHLVIELLIVRGALRPLFPAFRPVAPAAHEGRAIAGRDAWT